MALSAKPVDLQRSHLTKQEITERKEEEQKLKGNNNKVYKAPSYLSKEEKKLYKFIVKELEASNILNNLDITILETTVDAIVKMKECKKILDEHGLVTPKEDGTLSRNPASLIYKDYVNIFNKCCNELGLSPSSRAKLSVINVNAKSTKEDPVLQALRDDDK
ncbi:phage terminase small subunit P27 family [Clostridium autoethanogenum]|uniref:Phage terminase small subunit P27 family n=1 Tax=Clostridium autoethanogenum DSM 10061 TaxID=1341692 RepID=A0ABN4BK43_9CLOT|nr:phage terminase small subunit P27 family [Clostridium autoethanogenum]AGY77978.1 phage terminase small subunit P27 family [Clostridium autoethanogenum DSM 10061]ALU38112.1 Phage terminase-like protein small subunit [Clostridium autoethanogenum DSM 10061]OVY50876.1 Phage terminase, small subunit [Clostridium autoethanogenum]